MLYGWLDVRTDTFLTTKGGRIVVGTRHELEAEHLTFYVVKPIPNQEDPNVMFWSDLTENGIPV